MHQHKRLKRVLRGLRAATVWVHELEPSAVELGLSRQRLQDATVIRLLDGGLRALGIGNVPEPPGNPWIHIFVTTLPVHSTCAYHITVRLDEVVRIARNSEKTVATSWEIVENGTVQKEHVISFIESRVDELIDVFILDYLAENPQ
jgi:hypothetical protein